MKPTQPSTLPNSAAPAATAARLATPAAQASAPGSGRRGAPVVLALAAALGWPAAGMAQIGPSGPIGPDLPGGSRPQARQPSPSVTPPAGPAVPERTGNRVEVTGNTATRVDCARGGSASVNSVNIDRKRMEGETVIVQGRNSSDVRSQDCAAAADGQGQRPAGAQVNSVRVR